MDEIDTDWRHRGACKFEDSELFFPVGGGGPGEAQLADAKAVCRRCPVREQCLAWALTTGQDFGVWGAMSEDERRALKRRSGETARSGHRRAERGRRSSPLTSPPATRRAALAEIERGTRRSQVAADAGVSVRTVDRWIARSRTTAITKAADAAPAGAA